MKLFLIATIRGENDKLLGYKIFDSECKDLNKNKMLVDINNMKAALVKTPNLVKNLALINNEITGTNGKIDRYPRIDMQDNLIGGTKSPMIVINKLGDVGYTVVDYKGQVVKMPTDKVVEYAKSQGISNGKVVVKDSIEYISSITDEYDIVNITPSKTGANTRVSIPIHISSDSNSLAKHTAEDIQTEMEYNDVFSAMTPEQRGVIKQYYVWYTVDEYQKMAKNVRLNLAPGKAEKLSQLRGIDKWQFAGINDSFAEGNFKAHCELGHRLRYEYFAIPEEVAKEIENLKVRDNIGYGRVKRDRVQELRDNGVIVFGETCAGDFFNISPEDMKRLVKTRKTMSDEIELMSQIVTNHLEPMYLKKCKLLYQIIKQLNSSEKVVEAFGEDVGYTLLAFIQAKMPFPMSLVILASERAHRNSIKFFKILFPEYKNLLEKIGLVDKNSITSLKSAKELLEFITEYTIQGEYQYDPIRDKECIRKDVGRYNKETRNKRSCETLGFINVASVNIAYLNDIVTIEQYLKSLNFVIRLSEEIERVYSNSTVLKNRYRSVNVLISAIRQYAEDKSVTDDTSSTAPKKIVDYNLMAFSTSVISSLEKDENFKVLVTRCYTSQVRKKDENGKSVLVDKKDYYYYSSRVTTFYKLEVSRYYSRVVHWKNIKEISEYIESLNMTASIAARQVIGYLLDELLGQEEKEKARIFFYYITVKYDAVDKLDKISFGVIKLTYDENIQFKNELERKENKELQINGGRNTILFSDIKSTSEIDEIAYKHHLKVVDYNIKKKQEEEAEAQKQREKQDELARLADKQAEEERIAKLKAIQEDAKISRLKELIADYKGDLNYGIETSKAILSHGIAYSKLSSKQKWRIDTTLKELEDLNKQKEKNLGVVNEIDYDLDNIDMQDMQDMQEIQTEKKSISIRNIENNTAETEITQVQSEQLQINTNNSMSSIFENLVSQVSPNRNKEIKEKVDKNTITENREHSSAIEKEEFVIPTLELKDKNEVDNFEVVKSMIEKLKNDVDINTENNSNIKFAAQVAYTLNRTGKFSPKQYNYLAKGYKELVER